MKKPRVSEGLRRAYQAISAEFSGDGRLSLPQITVLRCLMAAGPIFQRQIVEQTGIDRSTLSELLRRMATLGMVVNVRRMADLRSISVSITPRGRAALLKADDQLADAEASLMRTIKPEDRAPFLRAIQAITEN